MGTGWCKEKSSSHIPGSHVSVYNPQRANSKPEQSQTQSTAVPGLGLALGPVFQVAVAAPVRSPSNP
jgi:hypothetical protein